MAQRALGSLLLMRRRGPLYFGDGDGKRRPSNEAGARLIEIPIKIFSDVWHPYECMRHAFFGELVRPALSPFV
jgi:hypothetical protein